MPLAPDQETLHAGDRIRNQFAWLQSALFWRTFFLLAFLITASMAAWIAGFEKVEQAPRAKQIAAQVISVVTITRAALTHSAPDSRRELLLELASNEGVRVYPLETTDKAVPDSDNELMPLIERSVKAKLGADTRFAGIVNGVSGFWVSFKIEDDEYWLMLEPERVNRASGIQWIGWATVTLLLSLLGAVFISRLINLPLARLTAAARAIAKGKQPEPLPEKGPTEIREANRSFNQMVNDLNQVESDRAIILAGISHDLRTPISRMLLEVEMANLPADARDGMQSDLAQMNEIIGQFLDYAKPADSSELSPVGLSELLEEIAAEAKRLPNLAVNTEIALGLTVMGNATDLRRVINNLIENARRYGKNAETGMVEIDIGAKADGSRAVIAVADRGAGIPEHEVERLLRPFTRMDIARGQANGAGLGLAIVERVVKRHGGTLRISNRATGGLRIEIELPLAATAISRVAAD
ncbi:ATP-binding protein [soil metagenome]